MIACLIEFAIKKGRESEHEAAFKSLLGRVEAVDGFISEEIFRNLRDGSLLMISYWENREAITQWMNDGEHRKAIAAGKEILSWYKVRIAEVEREHAWQAKSPE